MTDARSSSTSSRSSSSASATASTSTSAAKQTRWDHSCVPSQHGKIAIVTGANSGIGFETAKHLALRGATVVLACRNEDRGQRAQLAILEYIEAERRALSSDEQAKLAPPQVELLLLDVGSLASVRAFADAFRQRFDRLDLLINNAGVVLPGEKLTVDGLDSQFGINHIGHFLLTKLLLDLLIKSPAARIVSITSLAHRLAKMKFDDQGHLVVESGYPISKLAVLMFMYELERRLRAKGIANVIAVAAHPGLSGTDVVPKFIESRVARSLQRFAFILAKAQPGQSPAMGALPTLYAATAEDVQGMEHFGPSLMSCWGYPRREVTSVDSYNEELAAKLWTRSEALAQCVFDV